MKIEAVTKQQDEKRYPNIEMNLIDDLDECLVKTGDMFADQEHKSMFTSPYFKNVFPQAMSIKNHQLTTRGVPIDTSDDVPIYIGRIPFQQTCSEIGGMTQTINLHMKCKWHSYDTAYKNHVEDLDVYFAAAPICISKWCDTHMLRKQLSKIFAKGLELHFNEQIEFQNASCKVTSEACVSETFELQNLNMRGNLNIRGEKWTLLNPPFVEEECKDKLGTNNECILDPEDEQFLCEKQGGQLIAHEVKITYTDSRTMKVNELTVANYPHCVSRLCNLGRDKEDLEELFFDTLSVTIHQLQVYGYSSLSVEIMNGDHLY